MKQPHMLDLQDLAYVEQILQVSPQQVKKDDRCNSYPADHLLIICWGVKPSTLNVSTTVS